LSTLAGKYDIDSKILPFVEKFKERGIRQVIATDNFDVWDEFFLPQYSQYLDVYFEGNYNSAKFRILKTTHAEEFIKKILDETGVQPVNALLIDDNKEFANAFVKMGGQAINHESIADLARKLNKELSL
jgi:FMN phosphatase YigB (HAD superfamily)